MSDVLDIPQQETSADAEFNAAFAEFSGEAPEVPVVAEDVTTDPSGSETEVKQEAPEAEKPEEVENDIYAGLSEKQINYLKDLEKRTSDADHTIKSQIGRVSALQKKINEIESLKSTQKVAPVVTPDDPEWGSFKEEYPEMALKIEKRIDAAFKVMNERVGQATQPIQQMQHERYLTSQFAALEAAHPDYKEVSTSSEFRSWLSAQPTQIQAFAASEDAQEASYLLSSYKAIATPKQASGPSQVSEIKEQRKARLETSAGVQARGATSPSVGGAPDDFESAFAFFANKRETNKR